MIYTFSSIIHRLVKLINYRIEFGKKIRKRNEIDTNGTEAIEISARNTHSIRQTDVLI